MATPFVKESKRYQPLDISHLHEILVLLKRCGYSGVHYYDLGLRLGLHSPTLNVIEINNKGDFNGCLAECLTAWLQQRDGAKSNGGPTYDTLIQALRDEGENAVADGIQRENAVNKWLKEGTVDLTVKRVQMHGLPSSGKTCSQRLLLNQNPLKTDSTPIACRAVKATRISVHDDHMEEVDAKALLSSLAHDLEEAAAKQKEPPTEDYGTKSKEDSSENKTTQSADVAESAETTQSADATGTEGAADDTEAIKILNDIVEAIPNAKAKFDSHWVYIIDSGGQAAFQELLPLFTRASSFNIITIDLSKGIDEKLKQEYRIKGASFPACSQIAENSEGDPKFSYTNIEFLKDVLSSGAILKPYHAPSEEDTTTPEYFVLGTHKDKANQKVIKEYNKEVSSLRSGSEEKGFRIIPAVHNGDIIYPVYTLLESGRQREAEKLCKIIYDKASGVKFTIPVRWFAFELTLLEKAKGRSFLRINDVLLAGNTLQMTDAQTKEALKYLHNVTIILYYPQVLPDFVFLDPRPILDILSRLLALVTYQIPQGDLDYFLKKSLSDSEEENLNLRGLFTQALLEKLKDDEDFPKPEFIKLLLHLHIIIETDEQGEYFIPSALPSYPTSQPPESDNGPIQIIWRSPVTKRGDSREILPVPRGIFPLAIVNLMKHKQPKFHLAPKSPLYLRYRDAMSFRVYHQDNYIGTIHVIKKHRCIEIHFEENDPKYCSLIIIREAVNDAIISSSQAIKIKPDGHEFAFACPSTNGCYCIVTIDEKKVQCTLCTTPPPNNDEKEKYWSWFDNNHKKSSTEESGLEVVDGPSRDADSSDPVQTNTDPGPKESDNVLSSIVGPTSQKKASSETFPTKQQPGPTAEQVYNVEQVSSQLPTAGGGITVNHNYYNFNNQGCQIQAQGNSTVSGSKQTSTKSTFSSTNTVTAGKEENVSDDVIKSIKFLLMTATDPELEKVLHYLKPLDGRDKIIEKFQNGVDIYIGKYGKHSVVVAQSAPTKGQQGSLPAATVINKIMLIYKPRYIIAIGICFGMDPEKVNLGDVIVSDRIADFYNIRVEPGNIKARITDAKEAGDDLVSIFGKFRNFKMTKPSDKESAKEVKVHCGTMVSSPFLVDDAEFKKQLSKECPDALAGEMEGAGIFSATRDARHKVEAIVIKAVGDWANGKKGECSGWKPFACEAAAKYVHYHLDDDRTSEL